MSTLTTHEIARQSLDMNETIIAKWEDEFDRRRALENRIRKWITKTNEQMRLEMGEMTSQECRSVRAAMNTLLQPA